MKLFQSAVLGLAAAVIALPVLAADVNADATTVAGSNAAVTADANVKAGTISKHKAHKAKRHHKKAVKAEVKAQKEEAKADAAAQGK